MNYEIVCFDSTNNEETTIEADKDDILLKIEHVLYDMVDIGDSVRISVVK